MRRTVIESLEAPPDPTNLLEEAMLPVRTLVINLLENRFTSDWSSEVACKRAYEEHNAKVRDQVPSDRLFEWAPGDGWGPICSALRVSPPDEDFPHLNSGPDFRDGRF